ncbi:MAG: hypothetical protein ACK5QE_04080 [Sphingobacteriia bacterium]|jgi:hypothetical protein
MKNKLMFICFCFIATAYGQGSSRALFFMGQRVSSSSTEANPPAGISIDRSFFNNQSVYTWETWVFPSDQSENENILYSEGTPLVTFVARVSGGAFGISTWNQGIPGNWTTVFTAANTVPLNSGYILLSV